MKCQFPPSNVTKSASEKLLNINIKQFKPGFSKTIDPVILEKTEIGADIPAISDGKCLYLFTTESSKLNTILIGFGAAGVLTYLFHIQNIDFMLQMVTYIIIGVVVIMSSWFSAQKSFAVFNPQTQLVYLPTSMGHRSMVVPFEDIHFFATDRCGYIVAGKSTTKNGKWLKLPILMTSKNQTPIYIMAKTIQIFMSSPDDLRKLGNNLSNQINWFDNKKITIDQLTEGFKILTLNSKQEFSISEAQLMQ